MPITCPTLARPPLSRRHRLRRHHTPPSTPPTAVTARHRPPAYASPSTTLYPPPRPADPCLTQALLAPLRGRGLQSEGTAAEQLAFVRSLGHEAGGGEAAMLSLLKKGKILEELAAALARGAALRSEAAPATPSHAAYR